MPGSQNLYQFMHNSSHTRGFVWAMSIIPRSEVYRRECKEHGVVEEYVSGAFDVVVEGGTKYPDVLGCGEFPFLIVSEPVVDAWHEGGIASFHVYPVGITEVRSEGLMGVAPPRYFRVEIDGRCRIDIEASGGRVVRFVPQCHYIETQPPILPRFSMVPNSWDSSPLFCDPTLFPRVTFCTQEIVDIARKHQFTNFWFGPMAGPFDPKGVRYLGKH